MIRPYWSSEDRWAAWGLLVVVLVLTLAMVHMEEARALNLPVVAEEGGFAWTGDERSVATDVVARVFTNNVDHA